MRKKWAITRTFQSKLAFNFGAGFFYQIPANPPLGGRGEVLLQLEPGDLPVMVAAPRYAPTADRAGQFLYPADNLDWRAIVLASEGSSSAGEAGRGALS